MHNRLLASFSSDTVTKVYALLGGLVLAGAYLFSNRLRVLDGVPGCRFFSVAGRIMKLLLCCSLCHFNRGGKD